VARARLVRGLGLRRGLFADLTYLWWDLRLRPDLGTIEFRVANAQTSLDHTAEVAAICQCLVALLRRRLREGERLPVRSAHVLNENRWRAVRDGLDCDLVDAETGVPEPARARLARLLLELEPSASDLGCADELELAWPMLVRNGARRQRDAAGARGIDGLLGWLVDETEQASRRQVSGSVLETLGRPEQGLVLGAAVGQEANDVPDRGLTA
jgi:carboxylate-amine ligase